MSMGPQKIVPIKAAYSNPAQESFTKDLLHCRQFLLGCDYIEVVPGWQFVDVDHNLKLSIHPEVAVDQITRMDKKLTVIGDILDSLSPEKSNRDIISELIDKADGIESLTRATGQYGGRWILIASFGDKRYLFNDALGLRQVFYTDPNITGSLWMVSQPGLAEKYLHLESDQEAERFLDSYSARIRTEFRWLASGTAFQSLTHLLPNRYLDLNSGHSHRFWPYAPINTIPTKEAEKFLELRMSNLIQAAAARYPLALGITAGIDSRLVMALSKAVSAKMDFVTVRQAQLPDDHPDITIPGELCKDQGLKRVVVRAKASMSADFAKLFKDSVHMATDIYGRDAEAIINSLHRKKATVTGSAGEMGQCFLRHRVPENKYNGPLSAADLADLQGHTDDPYALKQFQIWLNEAGNRQDVKLLDLFYWEHSHGNWLAMTQAQFDIAWREIFTPYNCRDVLQAFLMVDENDRMRPNLTLQKNIIVSSWPELLNQPINPHEAIEYSTRTKIKRFLNKNFKRLRRIVSG